MMFVLTNIISVMPTVYASEVEPILYEYDDYTIGYSILDSWEDTQKVSVSIKNTGEQKIENWMIYFEPNGEITDIWDAEKAITNQPIAYIRNSRYNSDINAGESMNFTYLIKNNHAVPDSFILCQSRKEKEDGYSVSLNETYSWEEVNFKGEITIINDTDKPIESWELKVDTNFTINKITNSWAAEVTDLENGQYLLKCTYNYVIQPYSSVVLGFVGEKNGIPEIYNYSLTEITVDENILSSVIENKTEDEPEQLTELSLYAICTVMENELNISWITDKEVSDVEYRIAEINAGEVPSYIASTNELSYAYTLENNFDTKRIYIEAYYKDLLVGKSNDFIVKNSGGVFSSERVDTDGDNISDYIEGLIGTDINKADTDEDGLDDYLEFFVLDLDPLKNDTDENGILDGDEDSDGDGLTNLEESAYPTNPVNFDSDNDKLSDYDEIFVYNTDPLSEDTDNDTIFDYDEVMLGINPNDNSDFNKVIEQKIEKDSKCLAGINVEGLPYKVSIEIKASGYVEGSMKVDNSMSYASTYSFDTIGEIPEFSYNAGNVEEVTIDFEFEDEYIEENNIDISSLNVFKYFDGVNMFVPIKTFRNEDTNTLSCKSDSLGTYCVKDIDEWMLNFTEPDSEETEKVIMFLEDSDIAYMSDENDIELLSDDVFVKEEPINVVFALDQTFITGSLSGMENMKANVINVSEKLFGKYKNIKVTLMIYNNMGTYFDPCEDIGSLKNVLRNVEYICGDANNLPLIEAPMYSSTILLSNLNPKYLFIYNGFMNRFYPPEKSMVENALNNEKIAI